MNPTSRNQGSSRHWMTEDSKNFTTTCKKIIFDYSLKIISKNNIALKPQLLLIISKLLKNRLYSYCLLYSIKKQ